ncbi:MAG: hypothetical protein JNG89_10595, partial [Planctomycetaceae bacterium]|nr:hypothetical protein [Planctomycetaceae bacterium]
PQRFSIVYLGADDAADPASERFYVGPLFADTRERSVELIDWDRSAVQLPTAASPVRLVLMTMPPALEQMPAVQEYLRGGGLAIMVLRTPDAVAGLARLLDVPQILASEADADGFALLTGIDFEHPALAPFADPRYSDFTTLHFWKHRRIDGAAIPRLRVLARFDDGAPALGEIPVGDGRILLLTSGWNRADSQLAVWSKFVPLMNGLLATSSRTDASTAQLTVGDAIPWQSLTQSSEKVLTRPDGATTPLAEHSDDQRVDMPGVYTVTDGAMTTLATYAVNLSASESDTAPLPSEQLEALGIPLESRRTQATPSAAPAARRDVANAEVEQNQRLWRWVLLATVALLALETVYAGWLTRRDAAV